MLGQFSCSPSLPAIEASFTTTSFHPTYLLKSIPSIRPAINQNSSTFLPQTSNKKGSLYTRTRLRNSERALGDLENISAYSFKYNEQSRQQDEKYTRTVKLKTHTHKHPTSRKEGPPTIGLKKSSGTLLLLLPIFIVLKQSTAQLINVEISSPPPPTHRRHTPVSALSSSPCHSRILLVPNKIKGHT